MSLISTFYVFIDRNEHNDSGRYQGKNHIKGYLFTVNKQHVGQNTP